MRPPVALIWQRIGQAVAAWELNEIADACAKLDLTDDERAELQSVFAARCVELWPELVRRYR